MSKAAGRANVEERLRDFLQSRTPPKMRRVLVAVSGGCDSMALLEVAQAISAPLDLHVSAAHLIHHPNSHAALERSNLVRDYCNSREIPLAIEALENSNLPAGSPEERMRQARYRFLEEAAQNFSCDWILTGHHADDQAETVLLRILTGTGLRGLAGIPERRGRFLRPFLSVRKADLLQYCRKRGIPFAEDLSNLDLRIPRNRLRHEVLPLIHAKVNPEATAALLRLSRWAWEANEVISAETERCWKASLKGRVSETAAFPKGKIVLDIDAILPYFTTIRKNTLLKALGLTAGTEVAVDAGYLDRAEAFLQETRTGAILELPQGLCIVRHDRELIIAAAKPVLFQYKLVAGRNRSLPKLKTRAAWEKLVSEPYASGDGQIADMDLGPAGGELILRLAQEGDRFFPLGAPGEKRLFRFLTDRGVSRLDKRHTWVLERGGEIIWVVGHRISEKVRVCELKRGVWRLKLQPA